MDKAFSRDLAKGFSGPIYSWVIAVAEATTTQQLFLACTPIETVTIPEEYTPLGYQNIWSCDQGFE